MAWTWNEETLSVLLCTVMEAVTIVDADGVVQHWNHAAEQLYGIPAAEIVGKSILDFSWKSLMVERVLQDGAMIQNVYHEPSPGVHVLINTAPIFEAGRIVGAISTEQDVSSIVRLGQELMHSASDVGSGAVEVTQSGDSPWAAVWGNSATLQRAINTAHRAATTDATILITGESGVGKELFAHAVHKLSARKAGPFVAINCGAIPKPLFESELFGYRAGAFTGADRRGRQGKLEVASGGTLFLDEVGELPLDMQVKLLRVLEEGTFYPIGATHPVTFDVRIVAATNRELRDLVMEQQFRSDLYYRLNVVRVQLPALRERMEDIPLLIQRYLQEFSAKFHRPVPELDAEVTITLMRYDWPGNVRQLRNTVQRLVILAEDGRVQMQHLPEELTHTTSWNDSVFQSRDIRADGYTEGRTVAAQMISREAVAQALYRTYGNKSAAAKLLGVSRGTLYNYIQRYNLTLTDSKT